jgi:hypothetical protein
MIRFDLLRQIFFFPRIIMARGIISPAVSYSIKFSQPNKAQSFRCLRHHAALGQERKQEINEKDLMNNALQDSINQQIFPPIPERFLSELSEPPLNS